MRWLRGMMRRRSWGQPGTWSPGWGGYQLRRIEARDGKHWCCKSKLMIKIKFSLNPDKYKCLDTWCDKTAFMSRLMLTISKIKNYLCCLLCFYKYLFYLWRCWINYSLNVAPINIFWGKGDNRRTYVKYLSNYDWETENMHGKLFILPQF